MIRGGLRFLGSEVFNRFRGLSFDTPEPNQNHSADTPPTTQPIITQNKSDAPPNISSTKCAIFLCDSKGKYLNQKKLFPSNQEIKYFRCPRIESAVSLLELYYRMFATPPIWLSFTRELMTLQHLLH